MNQASGDLNSGQFFLVATKSGSYYHLYFAWAAALSSTIDKFTKSAKKRVSWKFLISQGTKSSVV